MNGTPPSPPLLIYLVTEDWYFWSHRLPMARAAQAAGFRVAVATRVAQHGPRIEEAGFTLMPLAWRRRSLNPLALIRAVWAIARLYRRHRPAVVHHVAMKPIVLGGLAAWLARVPAVVNAPTGLGTLFIGRRWTARLLAQLVYPLLGWLLRRRPSRVIVQNGDDRDLLVDRGLIDPDRAWLIRGSGVDVARYSPAPAPPAPPVVIAYVGRMLADKGVATLIAAFRRLHAAGHPVTLWLVGTPDPENPTSLRDAALRRHAGQAGIVWHGHTDDVAAVWRGAHIGVLASRREGLPKSLLEAAASARPLVATDVPGCREIARAGVNALLVPPDDAGALAEALARLVADAGLRRQFGLASRRLVEADFSAEAIGRDTVRLYRACIGLDPA